MINFIRNFERSKILIVGIALIILAVSGSTLAASITINNGAKSEFGQGTFTIRACQGWIQVGLKSGSTNSDGLSQVTGITFDGLDLQACKGTSLRLKLFGSSDTTSALNLYSDLTDPANPINYNGLLIQIDSTPQVLLVDPIGNPEFDPNDPHSPPTTPLLNDGLLTLTEPDSTGQITIEFTNPLALMSAVYNLTIESATTSG